MKPTSTLCKSLRTLLVFSLLFSYAQVYSQVVIPVEKEESVDTFSPLSIEEEVLVIYELLNEVSFQLLQLSIILILTMIFAQRRRSTLTKESIYFFFNPKLMPEIRLTRQGFL